MARFHRRRKGRASIKGEPKRKSLCYRQGGNDVSLLRNGSVACEKFHEHHVGMYGTDLHSRYRAMSINYTCFDGEACFSQSLCLTNTGVNNSKLTRLENFINDFVGRCDSLTCEQVHNELDDIEKIHGLYSPPVLGLAAALACGAFTFLLGGGLTEMICAFSVQALAIMCGANSQSTTLPLCLE